MIEENELVESITVKTINDLTNLLTENEIREQLQAAISSFKEADIDQSGNISSEELIKLCDLMGLPHEGDINDLLVDIDTDGSDEIDLKEWLEFWIKRVSKNPNPLKQQEVIARNTFLKYDTDNSGYLDSNELVNVLKKLGADFSDDEMIDVMKELDSDNSGNIEIEEFITWWTGRTVKNRQSTSLVALKLKKLAAKASQIFSTDIFTAVWNNDINLVKAFIQADKRIALSSDNNEKGNGWTPLHYASYKGHYDIIVFLLDNITNISSVINTTNDFGFTPLFYSSQNNHIEISKLLLDNGADPSICGIHWENPDIFMCPASFSEDSIELKNLFLKHSKCIPPKVIPINNIITTINKSNQWTIELPNQRLFTTLPILEFTIYLSLQDDNVSLVMPGKPPNIQQVYSVTIDKKWLLKVIAKLSDETTLEPSVDMSISCTNVMNMTNDKSSIIKIDLSNVIKDYKNKKTSSIANNSQIDNNSQAKDTNNNNDINNTIITKEKNNSQAKETLKPLKLRKESK